MERFNSLWGEVETERAAYGAKFNNTMRSCIRTFHTAAEHQAWLAKKGERGNRVTLPRTDLDVASDAEWGQEANATD